MRAPHHAPRISSALELWSTENARSQMCNKNYIPNADHLVSGPLGWISHFLFVLLVQ